MKLLTEEFREQVQPGMKPTSEVKKERPIIFETQMVKAILEGHKTQTRRIIKPEWSRCLDLDFDDDKRKAREQCPFGKVGDRLWVKETWMNTGIEPGALHYKASASDVDLEWFVENGWKWKSSRVMPRWASRIVLGITKIQVETLWMISPWDAVHEGFCGTDPFKAREEFAEYWDKKFSKSGYPCTSNPWVWVISFRVWSINGRPN